jgi:hypothetical protein
MKKSNLVLFVAMAFMSLTFVTSHAQVAMNSPRTFLGSEEGLFLKSKTGTSGTVNLKAEKNFQKDYHRTSGAEWSTLSDNTLVCRFFMNNILYRAFYAAQGQWKYTISGYDASKLDKNVYDKIKSVYYNSRIVFANQIDMVNGKTIYIVEIHDEKSIRKVRIDNTNEEEMEIVQELVKQ